MSKHTPGLLQLIGAELRANGDAAYDSIAVGLACSTEANARHLAACWNAIEDAGGDPGIVKELLAVCAMVDEEWHIAHDNLKRVEGGSSAAYKALFDMLCAWQDAARAAIAKATKKED